MRGTIAALHISEVLQQTRIFYTSYQTLEGTWKLKFYKLPLIVHKEKVCI